MVFLLANPEGSDSSIEGLSHLLSFYLARSLADRPDGVSTGGVASAGVLFRAAHAGPVLTCGVRLAKRIGNKKAVTTDPAENPLLAGVTPQWGQGHV